MMIAQPSITIPLSQIAHDLATQFAAEQKNPQKGTQVYLNTLAVYAVHTYLKWLQVESDLEQSDSWHPALRSLFNTADLVIPNIGKLECRPILPEATEVLIPAEVSEDRLGYIGVQLNEAIDQAHLIGFIPATALPESSEFIKIQVFQPLETVLDCLVPNIATTSQTVSSSFQSITLQNWFQNIFEAGWQSIDALIGMQPELSYVRSEFRPGSMLRAAETTIEGAKLIDLGIQLGNQFVVLLVAIAPDPQKGYSIVVQLHPASGRPYLPTPLTLSLYSQSGNQLQEVQARSQDNYIQMRPFWGQAGEPFAVKIMADTIGLTEYFTI
jgi:hypothetical protein